MTKRRYSSVAIQMMDLRRRDPIEYDRVVARKGLRLWTNNLKKAQAGEGFFKIDYCNAMINLYAGRMVE